MNDTERLETLYLAIEDHMTARYGDPPTGPMFTTDKTLYQICEDLRFPIVLGIILGETVEE